MKILIATDSFKGSMSSLVAAQAIKNGIIDVFPYAQIEFLAVADGGEGTLECLLTHAGGKLFTCQVRNPLGGMISAKYGILEDGITGVIETAEASGLPLVSVEQRNPMMANTYGTGELINACLERGCKRIIIGLGGSATVDLGIGMAKALGARFYDDHGIDRIETPQQFLQLQRCDLSLLREKIAGVEFVGLCDVEHVLYEGLITFAPQKGVSVESLPVLKADAKHFMEIVTAGKNNDIEAAIGSGAAGGLGAGLLMFLNAQLVKGADYLLDSIQFDQKLKNCDLLITGEGKIDQTTLKGKLVSNIMARANQIQKPVIALCGTYDADVVEALKLVGAFSILNGFITHQEAMQKGVSLLKQQTKQVFSILKLGVCNSYDA